MNRAIKYGMYTLIYTFVSISNPTADPNRSHAQCVITSQSCKLREKFSSYFLVLGVNFFYTVARSARRNIGRKVITSIVRRLDLNRMCLIVTS